MHFITLFHHLLPLFPYSLCLIVLYHDNNVIILSPIILRQKLGGAGRLDFYFFIPNTLQFNTLYPLNPFSLLPYIYALLYFPFFLILFSLFSIILFTFALQFFNNYHCPKFEKKFWLIRISMETDNKMATDTHKHQSDNY